MKCERVAELLPWLMNDTLDAAERALAREHLAQCAQCRRELGETGFAWSLHRQHVPIAALIARAYQQPTGDIEPAAFNRHLESCQECAEQFELARASRRLEEEEETTTAAQVVPLASRKTAWRRAPLWRYAAIAASLLLAVAIGGWLRSWRQTAELQAQMTGQETLLRERLARLEADNQRLQQAEADLNRRQDQSGRELAQLQAQVREAQAQIKSEQEQANRSLAEIEARGRPQASPQLNVLALDIYPVGLVQRGGATANELKIPPGAQAVTLILNSQAASDYRNYGIEIVNARNQVVWRARGLARHSTNDYTISVPADYLAPGGYTINVYGNAGGQRAKVESYQISVKK